YSIIGQKLSVREVELIIKNMKDEKKPSVIENNFIEYDFSDIKDRFNVLGLKTKTSKNKLTIEFDNESQITDFLQHISK
ncbi:MAG: ParB family chromosome partitioning protein, partial [Sulfurimonas sp.]